MGAFFCTAPSGALFVGALRQPPLARASRAREGPRRLGHPQHEAAELVVTARQPMQAGVRGVLLLAPPFVGEGGWSLPGFHLDARRAAPPLAAPSLYLFFGSADRTVPPAHAELYARTFPRAVIHRLAGGDHQFGGFMLRIAKAVRALARA